MLSQKRAELILQQIQIQGFVKISDLADQLQVSVDTIRRDLKSMEQGGLIQCVRGGACLPESLASLANFTKREIMHSEEKRIACRKAVQYVNKGMVVALNSGTTNTILAQELAMRNDKFTVVTNNLAAVQILMQNPAIRLIVVGGTIDSQEKCTYGSLCEQEFARYYPDICFLAINAVNEQDGFTDFRLEEIGIIQLLAARSRQVIAVMDSSKLGKRSKMQVLSLDQVDCLMTDDQISLELREKYCSKGLEIR